VVNFTIRRCMPIRWSVMCAALALFAVAVPSARALDQSCHTSSDYDLTVTDAALQFERKNTPGRRLEMRKGALAVNNQAVALGAADRQRVATFENRVRELVPKVKTIAQRGVDLMVVAVREEAVNASPGSAANPQVNARVDARAQELKTKIARSATSKEWHAEALQGYMAAL